MKKESEKNFWPALSIVFLFSIMNLYFTILVSLNLDFSIKYILVITNVIILPATFLFIELLGTRKKLWAKWKSFPSIIHKIICGICFLWFIFLSFKAFPAMKKVYEKN